MAIELEKAVFIDLFTNSSSNFVIIVKISQTSWEFSVSLVLSF